VWRKLGLSLLALLIIITVAVSLRVYGKREAANGVVFWDRNEAFVFLNVVRHGYHFSYLYLLVEFPMELLGYVPTPNDTRWEVVVLRVSQDSVQTVEMQRLRLGPYVLFGESIYAVDADDATLWKWNGTQFEKTNTQEQLEIRENWNDAKVVGHPIRPDFDAVNGWSARDDVATRTLKIDFQGATITLVGKDFFSNESIQLMKDGRPTATIWEMDKRPKKISRREYGVLFRY
jgi:hypothetical protein